MGSTVADPWEEFAGVLCDDPAELVGEARDLEPLPYRSALGHEPDWEILNRGGGR